MFTNVRVSSKAFVYPTISCEAERDLERRPKILLKISGTPARLNDIAVSQCIALVDVREENGPLHEWILKNTPA